MKAIAIIGLVAAGISTFIPLVGVFIAILASILAVISFKSETTISAITLGLNIITTAFLTPSLLVLDAAVAVNSVEAGVVPDGKPMLYFVYVGIHIVALAIAVAIKLVMKNKQTEA